MEEFLFEPIKITDKRLNLNDYKINSLSLLEFLFLSTTPKRIAKIFHELLDEKLLDIKDGEYEVEAILDDSDDEGEKKYLVKWKNWHIEFATWEPFKNLRNCKQEFQAYEQRKLCSKNKDIEIEYAQPKLELIRQIMNIVIDCRLEPKHINKYLKVNNLKRAPNSSDIIVPAKKRCLKTKKTFRQALEDWENLINSTYPLFKVVVENTQDNEGPPLDFKFITDYISNGISIPNDPPFGCHCTTMCHLNKAECNKIHGYAESNSPYTSLGKIRVSTGEAVYECNTGCKCDITCPYRVVQRGVRHSLVVFRTPNRGWGLKSANRIKKDTFIIEYLGEVITVDEAEKRGILYDQQNLTYLFDLDFAGDPEFTIDAYKIGNLSHFINHSCDPNMTSRCVYINCLDLRLPRIAFYASRDIKAGEELTFDYKMTGIVSVDEDYPKESIDDLPKEQIDDLPQEPLADSSKEPIDEIVKDSLNDTCLLEMNQAVLDDISTSTSSAIANIRDDIASEPSSVANSVNKKRVKCLCGAKNCRKYLY